MENKGTISVLEALKIIVQGLSAVPVPAGLIEQIGIPLKGAINDLKKCVDALEKKDGEEHADADAE